MSLAFYEIMRFAVDLDDDTSGVTDEIHDIRTDGRLPSK